MSLWTSQVRGVSLYHPGNACQRQAESPVDSIYLFYSFYDFVVTIRLSSSNRSVDNNNNINTYGVCYKGVAQ